MKKNKEEFEIKQLAEVRFKVGKRRYLVYAEEYEDGIGFSIIQLFTRSKSSGLVLDFCIEDLPELIKALDTLRFKLEIES